MRPGDFDVAAAKTLRGLTTALVFSSPLLMPRRKACGHTFCYLPTIPES
jgi:hypothetical protein